MTLFITITWLCLLLSRDSITTITRLYFYYYYVTLFTTITWLCLLLLRLVSSRLVILFKGQNARSPALLTPFTVSMEMEVIMTLFTTITWLYLLLSRRSIYYCYETLFTTITWLCLLLLRDSIYHYHAALFTTATRLYLLLLRDSVYSYYVTVFTTITWRESHKSSMPWCLCMYVTHDNEHWKKSNLFKA